MLALFKSQEEKDEFFQQKIMDKYSLEELDEKDLKIIKRIMNDLAGNGLFKIGMAFSFAKSEEQAKVTYLSALVEQNWMIIRQLSKLNQSIDEMKDRRY
jgi:hypothetical protein